MGMNCNQLQWFCRAYETRSFAKAAKASFVSRQAFGKAIKCMEQELGCILFQRMEQGVVPTEAANRIYPIVQRCVGDLHSVRKICSEHSLGVSQPVRIAIADGVIESLGDVFFDELERTSLPYEIVIEKHFYMQCLDYLKEDSVDFAIVPGPITDDSLVHVPLVREKMSVAVSPDLVDFDVESATLEDIATLPFFSLGSGDQAMLGLDILFREHGLEPRKVDRYTEYRIAMRKALMGTAAVLVPESMLSLLKPDMVVIPLPAEQLAFTINCCWLPRALNDAEEGVEKFMREHRAREVDCLGACA